MICRIKRCIKIKQLKQADITLIRDSYLVIYHFNQRRASAVMRLKSPLKNVLSIRV